MHRMPRNNYTCNILACFYFVLFLLSVGRDRIGVIHLNVYCRDASMTSILWDTDTCEATLDISGSPIDFHWGSWKYPGYLEKHGD